MRAQERAVADRPGDLTGALGLAERLRRAGEPHRALAVLQPIYPRHVGDSRMPAAVAELLGETGQAADGHELATKLLRRHPESADARAVLAELEVGRGRYDTALVLAREAVRLAPDSARACRAFAHACAVEKLVAELWPAFDRAIQLAPDDGGLLADYGETLGRYGRGPEAEAALRRAARLRPNDPRVLGLLGVQLGARADSDASRKAAADLLRRAATLAPEATEPRYQLGRLLLHSGDHAGAAAALEECLRIDPHFQEAWLPLAQAYQASGRAADARVAFTAARRYADYRRDAAHLELRLRRQPNSVPLLLRMAGLQERHGRVDLSLRYYRRAQSRRVDPAIARRIAALERPPGS